MKGVLTRKLASQFQNFDIASISARSKAALLQEIGTIAVATDHTHRLCFLSYSLHHADNQGLLL
ncbi:MAG: hypothetical protein COB20_16075 [SAR86 cluster bacterium]|uniref:Uncharacterized protein n=1 Tax=SAR86 cluster bacterium TaxID=2030880 RepID=A0A2A4WUY0_9GAMM|nr:MAG: hypothetical protein COB20_16075 [SAR86 cluster bacterium]